MSMMAHKRDEAASPIDNLIVGLGETGLSVARYLSAKGEPFSVADSRIEPPGLVRLQSECAPVEIHLGGFDRSIFHRARRLIVSPGVAVSSPAIAEARAAGAEVLGDVELFAREVRAPVIGITGSNGKSTVTTLLGEMARRAGLNVVVGGNLGTPALDLLKDNTPDLYVLELSSFQLETTSSLTPDAAVVLNISPDHLDRYASLDDYAKAKGRVFTHAKYCVVNRDDAIASALIKERSAISFGLGMPALSTDFGLMQQHDAHWLMQGNRPLIATTELRMAGRHNLANALASLALGQQVGLPLPVMLDALREFPGLPHRCQWIGNFNGADWYNDSKGTNVGATLAAIEGLDGPLVLIAGGQAKGQDFTPLRQALNGRARGVVLMGVDAMQLRGALAGVAPLINVPDMMAAVQAAAEFAQTGDRVLLSPACASLDMFANYAARGNCFVKAFGELSNG